MNCLNLFNTCMVDNTLNTYTMLLLYVFLITVLQGLSSGKNEDLGCDPDWYAGNGRCYYIEDKKQVTKKNAESDCDDKFATLLQINSADQMNYVKSIVTKFPNSNGFWTELTDLKLDGTHMTSGHWNWGSNVPLQNNTIQWEKYPIPSVSAACGAMTSMGKMKNLRCNQKLGYICKIASVSWCPAGWMLLSKACYLVSDVTDPTHLLTWNDANNACKTKQLPSNITSSATLLTFVNSVDYIYVSGALYLGTTIPIPYWTGLQKSGNSWKWSNGDRFMTDSIQWASEPDHLGGNEDCGVLKSDGTFSDEDCSKNFNYICQTSDTTDDTDYYLGCGGWWRAGYKCYTFYNKPRTTWQSARKHCMSVGADLLKVESLDEKHWIEQWTSRTENIDDYWVGLNDQGKEGVYRWADGALYNVSFVNWNQEPNHWFGTEHCVTMRNSGVFNDVDCSIQERFICEYASPKKAGNCPVSSGWYTNIVNGGCYYVAAANETRSWYEADNFCRSIILSVTRETTLLALNSMQEVNWVLNILKNDPFQRSSFWTDLNNRQAGGGWLYTDEFNNPPQLNLINWRGEPDDPTGNEDCVYMGWSGRYFDVRCNISLGFICQKHAKDVGIVSGKTSHIHDIKSHTLTLILASMLFHLLTLK